MFKCLVMKLLLVFFMFLVCSCTTLRSFEKEKEITSRDTLLVQRDTVERVITVPGETKTVYLERMDTVWLTKIIPDIRIGKFTLDTLWVRSTHAEAWFGVRNNQPFFGITQHPIDLVVASYRERIMILVKQLKEREKQVVKRYRFYENPWFWAWAITICIVVGLGCIGFKGRK